MDKYTGNKNPSFSPSDLYPATDSMIPLDTRQCYHAAILCLIICIYSEYRRRRRVQRAANPRGLPYPPGLRRLPIIGNVFDIARNNETEVYQRLADIYGEPHNPLRGSVSHANYISGDLVFLSAFGKNILFLNSFEMTTELFDKRSLNYSDRSTPTMCYELCVAKSTYHILPQV